MMTAVDGRGRSRKWFWLALAGLESILRLDTLWVEIIGGNHDQFGNFGPQPADFEDVLSLEKPQREIVNSTSNFIALILATSD